MRILVVHQHYLAPGQPGGSRFNELARLWREAGHDVTVVAGNLNYATSETPPELQNRWNVKRVEDGITVWRCHVPSTYNRGHFGRMWAFFGFTLSSVTAILRAERPDVVIATSPPLTTAITGWVAARWHRVNWVFEVRDLWPESAVTTGVLSARSPLTRLLYGLERFACRHSDMINVLTPAFRTDLVDRGLAPMDKIVFVPNGADLDAFVPGSRENEIRSKLGWGSRFVALYAGAHGRANALHQLVDAAGCLRNRPDILIATVGDGPERAACEAAARARGLTNLQFLGPQPKTQMPSFVRAADAGLAVLQNNPTFRTVYPNKVFDYMACERPTVLGIDGVARTLVCDNAQAGLFANPEDGADLARVILSLADDSAICARLGQNGRRWVLANAGRCALADLYLRILMKLARADRANHVGGDRATAPLQSIK
ncbi:MAG TPA: glycosyltransferase family 4 protein [Vicinamibacterales bacterium]|nr:glycosyltransferase family 4 protein [Vicinamibacterales bacterium]